MNKYESAIEYFFNIMETGNIKDDRQQEVFELAIDALSYMSKLSKAIETVDYNKESQ